MTSERFAEIKLPAQFKQLVDLINERSALHQPRELWAAKAKELVDLKKAILSSPDRFAWRQGITPEAYRNPTAYGGTDPRNPFEQYTRLPGPTPQDSWIPRGGGPFDRMANDGKVYTFKDLKRVASPSGYLGLLDMIEKRLEQITSLGMCVEGADADHGSWKGQELGGGLGIANPQVIPHLPDWSTPGVNQSSPFPFPDWFKNARPAQRITGWGQTDVNPTYLRVHRSRKGFVDAVAWKAALERAGLAQKVSASGEYKTRPTKDQVVKDFDKVRPYYWEERLKRAVPGEFNEYNQRLIRAKELRLRNKALVPIGPDSFAIQLHHIIEKHQDPGKALDPNNLRETFGRQHDFQHPEYGFRWGPGNVPQTPHASEKLPPEFGDPTLYKFWP